MNVVDPTIGKKKAALTLSGGGALGIAHLGVVQVLNDAGYEFDFFTGTSAGAIVAAGLACGLTAERMFEMVRETNLWSLAFDRSSSDYGLIGGNKVHDIFREAYNDMHFSDLEKPLYICTTDFLTGQRVMLDSGPIADAVRASISVPMIFAPFYHTHSERWLVDGGLVQNFPLDTAIEYYGGGEIIGCDVAGVVRMIDDFHEKSSLPRPAKLRRMVHRSLAIMFSTQQQHFPRDDRVSVLRPNLKGATATDRSRKEHRLIFNRGAAIAQQFLEEQKQKRRRVTQQESLSA